MHPLVKTIALLLLLLTLSPRGADAADQPKARTAAIVLYDGVEILDFAGPSEVLAAAAGRARETGTPLRMITVARNKAAVTAQGFVKVMPEFSIEDAPHADIIVIPGGASSNLSRDPQMFAWLKKAVDESEVTLTVCTGVFPVVETGALDNLEITTFYGALDDLKAKATKSRVEPGRRFIDNGKFITTAGVSAGIDGSLHLVARLYGRQIADRTAQYMEYHWTPESFLARNYQFLNPSTNEQGRSLQLASMYGQEGNSAGALAVLEPLVKANPSDGPTLYAMAKVNYDRKAFKEAADAYERAASTDSLRQRALYNAACSASLAGDVDRAGQFIRKAYDAGVRDLSLYESDPDLANVRNGKAYKELVAQLSATAVVAK